MEEKQFNIVLKCGAHHDRGILKMLEMMPLNRLSVMGLKIFIENSNLIISVLNKSPWSYDQQPIKSHIEHKYAYYRHAIKYMNRLVCNFTQVLDYNNPMYYYDITPYGEQILYNAVRIRNVNPSYDTSQTQLVPYTGKSITSMFTNFPKIVKKNVVEYM